MKCYTKESLEDSRPDKDALEVVEFCVNRLFDDRVHCITDEVVHQLTYEELIGALLLARDEISEKEE